MRDVERERERCIISEGPCMKRFNIQRNIYTSIFTLVHIQRFGQDQVIWGSVMTGDQAWCIVFLRKWLLTL